MLISGTFAAASFAFDCATSVSVTSVGAMRTRSTGAAHAAVVADAVSIAAAPSRRTQRCALPMVHLTRLLHGEAATVAPRPDSWARYFARRLIIPLCST